MNTFFSSLLMFIRNPIKRFRLRYILFIMIALLLYYVGKSYWNKPELPENISQPQQASTPAQDDPQQNTEFEEQEADEEGSIEDEDTNKSPWPLLQTALSSPYSKALTKQENPSVSIIVTGLGLNESLTEKALALPSQITLAFSPYSPKLKELLQRAKDSGHQTLACLPMEPNNYPDVDPGYYTLLTGTNTVGNIDKIKELLKLLPQGTGLIREYGSRFLTSQSDLEPVLTVLKSHPSFFVDPNTTIHSNAQNICQKLNIPYYRIEHSLSSGSNSDKREAFFKIVLQKAIENGMVVISISAQPENIDHLLTWLNDLKTKGVNLVLITKPETNKELQETIEPQQSLPNDKRPDTH